MARVLLAVCLLILAVFGFADGKFYGTSSLSVDMPQQRAVIRFHDGVQAMAIESQARGSGAISLVVPVPSPKTEVFDVQGSRARRYYRSGIYADTLPGGWEVPGIMAVLAGVFLLAAYATAKTSNQSPLLALLILFIVAVILFPVFAQSRSGEGTQVLKSFQTESFRADLVKGNDASSLRKWLSQNETPLPAEDAPVIEDYIKKGWCFVAVHFMKPIPEAAAPPPLGLEFPTDSLVYPMRLTAQGTEKLSLELILWTQDSPVTTNGMIPLEVRKQNLSRYSFLQAGAYESKDVDGWMTRLVGSFRPAELQQDLQFRKIKAEERTLYPMTTEGRLRKATYWGIGGLVVGTLLALLAPPWRKERVAEWTVLLVLLAGVLLAPLTPFADVMILSLAFPLIGLAAYFNRYHAVEDRERRARGLVRFSLGLAMAFAIVTFGLSFQQPTLHSDGHVSLPPGSQVL